jgi:hypothetical protein
MNILNIFYWGIIFVIQYATVSTETSVWQQRKVTSAFNILLTKNTDASSQPKNRSLNPVTPKLAKQYIYI